MNIFIAFLFALLVNIPTQQGKQWKKVFVGMHLSEYTHGAADIVKRCLIVTLIWTSG